jgi:hypothetical protein
MRRPLILVVLILATAATRGTADDAKRVEFAKASAEAARKVYEAMVDRAGIDPRFDPDPERLYLWSRRWMEAEQAVAGEKAGRVAAAQAHFARMKKWEAAFEEKRKNGTAPAYQVPQVRFYRLEAEMWLAETK